MKLKPNMYVRVKEFNYTIITKITKVDHDGFNCENNMYYMKSDVLKASYSIIGLIKIGDYVNGYKVNRICSDEVYCDDYMIRIKDIKSIVTKEQFESMQYKVNI